MGRSASVSDLPFEDKLRPRVEDAGADWPIYGECLSRLLRPGMAGTEIDKAVMWASFDYIAEAHGHGIVHIPVHHLPFALDG